MAIPGSSSGANTPMKSASAAPSRQASRPMAAAKHVWQPAEAVLAVAYRHADRRLARQAGEHAAALERARRRSDPARRLQQRRPCRRARTNGRGPRASPGCSIPPTRRRPARSCGCGRNISSPRPRCRICCAAICSNSRTRAISPTRLPIQLNDTHPAIAVAELMRLLVDTQGIAFDEAWDIVRATHLLHQSHAAAGGAGELAGPSVRAAAAAPYADHLCHQQQADRGSARPAAMATARRCRRCR